MRICQTLISLVFILLLAIGCKDTSVNHGNLRTSPSELVRQDWDSLLNNGVDSLLMYYRHCSGCVPGSRDYYYLIWMEDGRSLSKAYQVSEGVTASLFGMVVFDDFASHKDAILNTKLDEPSNSLVHGWQSGFVIRMGDQKHEFSIFDDWISVNYKSQAVVYLARIESVILRTVDR
ncbi:MAG: hypothetical protein IPP17_03470 [Bacteroidetes bacterium]|nr:hypothetical protein [Bacteroidota bacterium]